MAPNIDVVKPHLRRPDAIAAAVLRAPFVDLLTAMTQPELSLTAHEYGEWGDVRADPAAAAAVRP